MLLRRITLQHFRNFDWLELAIDSPRLYLVGTNGQGKTNLLEAIALSGALRSFRTSDARDLISHGREQATLAWEWARDGAEVQRVVGVLRPGSKELLIDGERIDRIGDFLGRFPSVVFSSHDLQLVRGGPAIRRRWMDALLSTANPDYLRVLQRFTKALESRNRLLREGAADIELEAFERQMAESASGVVAARLQAQGELSEVVCSAASRIAAPGEEVRFDLRAGGGVADVEGWLEVWRAARAKDRILKSTTAGPHREDILLSVNGHAARDFASEGQQRTLVLALRLAEAAYVERLRGRRPLILADDVLGELDGDRRRRFWDVIGTGHQVVATGTSMPDFITSDWQVMTVGDGRVRRGGGSQV